MKTSFVILILLCGSCAANACLREEIDEKAIQWSSQIVEARLVQVSERIEMKALAIKGPPGSRGEMRRWPSSARCWLRRGLVDNVGDRTRAWHPKASLIARGHLGAGDLSE